MTVITAELVKEIRERTGVGLAKCKAALEECGGDIEKAIEALRKAGIASAVKRESRVTKEGRIEYFETPETLAVVEMNAETDFVVNNDRFRTLHRQMIELLAKSRSKSVEELLQTAFPKEPSKRADDARKELISVLGENINIPRVALIKKQAGHSYGVYSHMGGKIFVMCEIAGSHQEVDFAKEIAMHIAAEAPEYLRPEEVPANVKAKEEEIAKEQAPKDKPAQVVEKIIQGKVKAFYDQVCLLNQKYIKDNAMTVAQLVANYGKKIGKEMKISRFVRWQIGGA